MPASRPRPALRDKTARILDLLEDAHPEATCALSPRDPFQLLVATILSAQCTDQRVNQVTPALFSRYPTSAAMAQAPLPELEELIRSTGFFRAKARSIQGCSRGLLEQHQGKVPTTLEELVKLPGIGRKTANVVLSHAFGLAEGIAVDTHVLRVSNRLGLARGDDAVEVERQLMAIVPRERWARTTDLLIFHGRKICDARRPVCGSCVLFSLCQWRDRQAVALGAAGRPGPPKRASRARSSQRPRPQKGRP
ncbi:MAG TPA: endonuclease III [Vicinamibacteria bacterium]|nr:endonuclease III [Vicinamibacteria bacterium]